MTGITSDPRGPDAAAEFHDDIIYPDAVPFVLVHLACLAAIWTGVTATALLLCGALYVVRMFGVTAGYHRYFSHRAYKTSRAGQFLLALLCQSSTQKSVLWWAAMHRHHHRHSDTELDIHSPRHRGFWYSHLGWIFSGRNDTTDYDAVPDLARYPELRWLDRHDKLPAVGLAVLCFLLGGWPGLVVGFFGSTVLLYHGTFMINSLAHVHGTQRYVTGDDSRNNWWLALITLGEGWHNNHHHYQSSTRQGFRWWEIDPTYYALRVLAWTGIVWELRAPPAEVVRNERPLGRRVQEKVAQQLAGSFAVAPIAAQLHAAWSELHPVDDLVERLRRLSRDAGAALTELEIPSLPSVEELRARALDMYDQSPSLDAIAARARQILAEMVSARLLDELGAEGAV